MIYLTNAQKQTHILDVCCGSKKYLGGDDNV